MAGKLYKGYWVVGILLLVANGLCTACKSSTPTSEPDQVALQINWSHEAEFAGYYVAGAQGFYTNENIAVTIREGGLHVDSTQVFLRGETEVTIMTVRQQRMIMDPETKPIAVAATFQILPQILFSLSDSGIQKPQDLIGRRVAIKNEIWRNIIHNMLTNTGIDPAAIIEVEVAHDAIELLYNGEVDVWTGYIHNEPTEAQLAGYKLNLIFPAEYGAGTVDGVMVVHQNLLDRNPDLIERFVRASLRGWQYVVDHPDKAAEIVAKWQPDKSLEFHQIAVKSLVPLIHTGQVPIGWIDEERWKKEMGNTYNPDRPGYTMQFIHTVKEK